MEKIKCCVVDDEPLAQELIKRYIEQTPFLEFVSSFSSASAAIKTIIEDDIDLVFLDIQMPELNGIEFSKVISNKCKIIFTTAFSQYAIDAFKANAIEYLLKPISYPEFLNAANKALQVLDLEERASHCNQCNDHYIIVKSEYKLVQIPLKEITYIESIKDYVRFCLENGTTVMSLMSIKNIEEKLSKYQFMRVHRSFIVNTSKITLIERNRIVFGKQYIPVSETYKIPFFEYINQHSFVPIKDTSL